jgi:hypothetical protein
VVRLFSAWTQSHELPAAIRQCVWFEIVSDTFFKMVCACGGVVQAKEGVQRFSSASHASSCRHTTA